MPLSSTQDVFTFEINIPEALKTWFFSQGVTIYTQGMDDTPPTDWVDVTLDVGEATGHMTLFPSTNGDITGFTITGAETGNGTYTSSGTHNGKASFTDSTNTYIFQWHSNDHWQLRTPSGGGGATIYYSSDEDVDYPWQVQTWSFVTAISGSPVFSNFIGGDPAERYAYDQYNCVVTYTVRTRRDESNNNLHFHNVAKVRNLVSYLVARGSDMETQLDPYAFNTMVPGGTTNDTDGVFDVTELVYAAQFTIKPDAWPTT